MTTPAEQMEELRNRMWEIVLPTLLALDRKRSESA